MFGAPVRFGATLPGIALRKEELTCRNLAPAKATCDISIENLPDLMGNRPPNTAADRVLTILPTQLELGDISMDAIAARLSLGTRTLERKLAAEGASFRELRQQFLCRRAIALLASGDWSVGEVANALGYEEPNSFSRAFRKWTGRAPTSALRAAHPAI